MVPMEQFLEKEGFRLARQFPEKGWCAVRDMLFTFGLFIGCTKDGTVGRYCYHSFTEAKIAIEHWDGIGDPPGNWIKYKGEGGERRNPNYKKP